MGKLTSGTSSCVVLFFDVATTIRLIHGWIGGKHVFFSQNLQVVHQVFMKVGLNIVVFSKTTLGQLKTTCAGMISQTKTSIAGVKDKWCCL